MPTNKEYCILIVDDSPDDIRFLLENLKHEYAILVATSGKQTLEIASRTPEINVILLDVNMPEMDGHETCRHLKSHPDTQHIDVIFVSAHDSTHEKLKSYEAGGNDHLIKPVVPEELRQKVQLAISHKKMRIGLEAEKNYAMETAMTAMTSTGEFGIILDFFKQSSLATDISTLGTHISTAILNYSLENSVQIRSEFDTVNLSSKQPMPPLEQELLTRLSSQGRILEHGKRLIFNFEPISVLIKNMPLDDPDTCGRIRDNVAILLEGAQSILKSIETGFQNELLKTQLQTLIINSTESLLDIQERQHQLKAVNVQIMDGIMQQLENSFLSLGLSEIQEAHLLNIVRLGVDKALDNFEKGLGVDEQLQTITEKLQRAAD